MAAAPGAACSSGRAPVATSRPCQRPGGVCGLDARLGNLLIVDHGDAYLSIYGNNDSLLKQVGQSVKGGETVATVGNSGAIRNPVYTLSSATRGNRSTR